MHTINTKKYDLRTDLIMDNDVSANQVFEHNGVSLYTKEIDNNNYSTITFIDITDKDQKEAIEHLLVNELKRFIDCNNILVIGLGNRTSTPDALGPKVLDRVLVTRHLFELGNVSKEYKNVSIIEPSVYGKTGISSIDIIKEVVELIKPECCIIIDSLCTSTTDRLNKTIQITTKGINPGSGVNNDRGELSIKTLGCKVIAIGVPTVIDIDTIVTNALKEHDINEINIEDNLIVTPKDIDNIIEELGIVIGTSINNALHTTNRQ